MIQPINPGQENSPVNEAFIRFNQQPILAIGLQYWPVLLVLYATINFVFFPQRFPKDPARLDLFQTTGMLVYATILIVLQVIFIKGEELYVQLKYRGVLQETDNETLYNLSRKITAQANDTRILLGFIGLVLFVGTGLTINACHSNPAGGNNLLFCNFQYGPLRASKSIIELLTALIIAPCLWKIIVAIKVVWGLGQEPQFNLNWNHPDKCSGLRPVGDLCFWLASLTIVPAFYFGFWAINCGVNEAADICNNITQVGARVSSFQIFILLLLIASVLSFLVPLWSTHRQIARKREKIHQEKLLVISQKIDGLSRQIVTYAIQISGEGEEKGVEEVKARADADYGILQERLETLKNTYLELEHISAWPFDATIVKRIIGAYIIPVLGFSGVGSNIIELLQSFVR